MPEGWLYRSRARSPRAAMGRGPQAGPWVQAPVGAFLVEHPRAGLILVDTGLHPVVATRPTENMGWVNGRFFRLTVQPHETVPARLRRLGHSPRDVAQVVMTHLHGDHTSAMSEFPSATFLTTPAEWRAARRVLGFAGGYVRAHLPHRASVRFVDFDRGRPRCGLGRTLDLLGDGSVRLVSTPGHTVDHLSVLVQTAHGAVFLLGDAVYTLRNLDENALPWRTADDATYHATMNALRAYRRECPGTLLVPTHDADAWDRLGWHGAG